MKKLVAAVAAAGLYSGNSLGDYGEAYIMGFLTEVPILYACGNNPPSTLEFVVHSNATQYIPKPGGDTSFGACVDVVLSAEGHGRIKWYQAYLKTRAEGGSWTSHKDGGVEESWVYDSRQSSIYQHRQLEARFENLAAMHCNNMADVLRTNGWDNQTIFSQDRYVNIEVATALHWDMSLGTFYDDNEVPYPPPGVIENPKIQLVCKAFEPSTNPHFPPNRGDQLVQEQLATIEYIGTGMEYPDTAECPTDVTLSTVFMSREQGDFTFRFESAFGQISNPIQLTMGPADEIGGQYFKTYHKVFPAGIAHRLNDDAIAPLSGGNLRLPGGGDRPTTDSLVMEQNNAVVETIDGLANDMPGPNVAYDSLRVVLLSAGPGSETASGYKDYRIDCESGGNDVPINRLESTQTLMY